MTLKQWNRRFERSHRRERASSEAFAAAAVDVADPQGRLYLDSVVAKTKQESVLPWKYYEGIGEVHYSVGRSARVAGYATLHVLKRNDSNTGWDEDSRGPVRDIRDSIYSSVGGLRGLIDTYYGLMKVPGDAHLIRVRDGDGDVDGYEFIAADAIDAASVTELAGGRGRANSPLRWITIPNGAMGSGQRFAREVRPEDYLGRVWVPSRRFIDVPDTPLNAMRTECDVLMILTRLLKARLRQRFALAGILFIPQEIAEARISGIANDGVIRKDDILNFLRKAMTANVNDWETATALTPILVRGPAEVAEAIKHITIDSVISEQDLELRQELIGRILFGLDINQQATKGTGEANHWGAWAVSDEERRIAVQPDLEAFCWALTRLVLHAELAKLGWSPQQILRYKLTFDLSAAAVRTNQQEDGRQLSDRGVLSDRALRRVAGFADTDTPSEAELVRWAGRVAKDPYLMLWGLEVADEIDWTKVATQKKNGPTGDSTSDEPRSGPGVGDPGSPDDNDSDTPRTERPA